jgi:hypothetical protein
MFYAVADINRWIEFGTLIYDLYAYLCLFTLSAATILSIYSGVDYLVKNKDVFSENKKPKKTWEEKTNE